MSQKRQCAICGDKHQTNVTMQYKLDDKVFYICLACGERGFDAKELKTIQSEYTTVENTYEQRKETGYYEPMPICGYRLDKWAVGREGDETSKWQWGKKWNELAHDARRLLELDSSKATHKKLVKLYSDDKIMVYLVQRMEANKHECRAEQERKSIHQTIEAIEAGILK